MSGIEFVLDCLDRGKEIEAKGIIFYTESAGTVKDAKGRETLKFLANEEKEHLRFIDNLLHWFKENERKEKINRIIKEHKNILESPKIFPKKEEYEKRLLVDNTDKKVLKEAKNVEERSIKFYEECKYKVDEIEYKEILSALVVSLIKSSISKDRQREADTRLSSRT